MSKVKSFNLSEGDRISNYRVCENVGRGWEGEVYKVEEVPTGAIRALKLFRTDELDSVRHVIHFAWYYEQVRCTGHFPTYYHYGQWFFDDDNGCWFLIFEFVDGNPLKTIVKNNLQDEKEALFFKLVSAVADVHEHGYAIGDFDTLDNVFLTEDDKIIFIDCEPGKPDDPNTDFRNDCTVELVKASKTIFGKKAPASVAKLLTQLKVVKRFNKKTLLQKLS